MMGNQSLNSILTNDGVYKEQNGSKTDLRCVQQVNTGKSASKDEGEHFGELDSKEKVFIFTTFGRDHDIGKARRTNSKQR